jgi:hypothetical protein
LVVGAYFADLRDRGVAETSLLARVLAGLGFLAALVAPHGGRGRRG